MVVTRMLHQPALTITFLLACMPFSSHPDCPALLALTRHAADRLEAMAAPLLSAQPNWVINRRLGCTCGDCYIAQVVVVEGRQEQGLLAGWLPALMFSSCKRRWHADPTPQQLAPS